MCAYVHVGVSMLLSTIFGAPLYVTLYCSRIIVRIIGRNI